MRLMFGRLAWLLALFSTLLNVASLTYEEVIDDHVLLHNVAQRGCGPNPIECFQKPVFGLYYRPLLSASFSIATRLHGTQAWGHHLENLLLHFLMTLLAFWFFRRLFRQVWPALFAGTLFALHPLQVPVTTFIGGRTDTIALLFLMVFGIGLLTAIERKTEGRSSVLPLTVSMLGFTAAVFTKEQVIPLVLLVPLLALLHQGGREKGTGNREQRTEHDEQKNRLAETMNTEQVQHCSLFPVPFSLLFLYLIPVAAYLFAANRVIPRNSYEPANWGLSLHIEMVGRTLWYYAKALFFPTVDTLHQSTLGQWYVPQPVVMFLGFFCAGLWLAALYRLWPNRTLRFFWLWTTLTLVSCLNVIPIPSQFAAPYRAVIPAFGVGGLLGYGLSVWWMQRKSALALPVFLLLSFVYACVSLADVPHWRDDVTLIRMEVRADPDYIPAQSGLAGLLQARAAQFHARNQEAQARVWYSLAREQYNRVITMFFPNEPTVEAKIARLPSPELYRYVRGGSGLRYKPMDLINVTMRGSGGTHQSMGEVNEAIADYRVALAAKPSDDLLRDYLAFAYSQAGRYLEAEATIRDTIKRLPSASRYLQLAELLVRLGRFKEAQETLLETMMRPDFASLSEQEKNRVTGLYNATARASETK
jgi:tetratricopeptide (TPR) repeat protein